MCLMKFDNVSMIVARGVKLSRTIHSKVFSVWESYKNAMKQLGTVLLTELF